MNTTFFFVLINLKFLKQESASTSYMWYSESEDSRVEGIMEELSKQNNFSKDLTVRQKFFINT